jgi:ankyrin repeat protein
MSSSNRAASAEELVAASHKAFAADDAEMVRRILAQCPELKARLNDPMGPFDSPAILCVRSKGMLDVLLEAGADINARSRWWAGGFGLLDQIKPELADYAISRGAKLDAHSAARLGKLNALKELIAADPALVHARGGDGQTPLHFASTVEVAECLLAHGANIDARDVDHESTPAQYMLRERQEVARHLVKRGCHTDLLMASALGDLDLVREILERDKEAIRIRVDARCFPMRHDKSGGTIYQWTLGWHASPHQVAKEFGHAAVLEFLISKSPPDVLLIHACWSNDEPMLERLLREHPAAAPALAQSEPAHIANAARDNKMAAVRLLLKAGWPVDARGQHQGTPLHWAAWHGDVPMVEFLIARQAPLNLPDADFHAPPIGWAMHASEHGWHPDQGDYAGTVRALLRAGAKRPEKVSGTEAVRNALAA